MVGKIQVEWGLRTVNQHWDPAWSRKESYRETGKTTENVAGEGEIAWFHETDAWEKMQLRVFNRLSLAKKFIHPHQE